MVFGSRSRVGVVGLGRAGSFLSYYLVDLIRRLSRGSGLVLDSGARVAVMGGGPAGSFFSYFLLDLADRRDLDLKVDIFEAKDFSQRGPAGCNMCGGVISESLVQALALDGINLPAEVIERGIDSYTLHMDVGSVMIETPRHELRIGCVHRGAGPKDATDLKWRSFDEFLLELAQKKGACLQRTRIESVSFESGKPVLKGRGGLGQTYDFLAVAAGVNSSSLGSFGDLGIGYKPPKSAKTYVSEFYLGQETIHRHFGNSMQVFLLDLPGLDFAALIPKGDYVTLCLLGQKIDDPLIQAFLKTPEVRHCLPEGWEIPAKFCHCSPRINVAGSDKPFADRIVFIGDCGVSRLYKDGIGAAYRTAKAAARTAVFSGVAEEDFRAHFWPVCRALRSDNAVGKIIFALAGQIQNFAFARRALLQLVAREQQQSAKHRRLSTILWDTFTGSARYADIFRRGLHPVFLVRFAKALIRSIFNFNQLRRNHASRLRQNVLGR